MRSPQPLHRITIDALLSRALARIAYDYKSTRTIPPIA